MMKEKRLLYSECIRIYEVEESFIESLHEIGLIHIIGQEDEKFIEYEELSDLEQFIRWYYEMDINVEGIDALRHILKKVKNLQSEVDRLSTELQFYKSIL